MIESEDMCRHKNSNQETQYNMTHPIDGKMKHTKIAYSCFNVHKSYSQPDNNGRHQTKSEE